MPFLSHWSVCLSLFQFHPVLILVRFEIRWCKFFSFVLWWSCFGYSWSLALWKYFFLKEFYFFACYEFILIFYSFWVSFGNLYLLRMYAFHPGCLNCYHELLIFPCNSSHFYRVYSDILSFILDFDDFFFLCYSSKVYQFCSSFQRFNFWCH